jgi:ubiquinone/menaquinone biosynthesis C-methylase UbiE
VDEAEFDRFADEYRQLHASNIRASGESPEFFAEYKIADVSALLAGIGVAEPGSILDFGAGVGTSVPFFRRYFKNCKLTCADVSYKSLEVGRARFASEAEFIHFDGTILPFPDGTFDVAFVACVLHHISHAEHLSIMRELLRVLRPGGSLVIFEHNPFNPLTVQAVNTCEFDKNAVLISATRLRKQVLGAGFDCATVRYRIFFPRALRLMRKLEPLLTWLPLGAQYSIHARKH